MNERIEQRIEAVDTAIAATKMAMNVDRKLTHDKHFSGQYTKALTELTDVKAGLNALRVRMTAVGR